MAKKPQRKVAPEEPSGETVILSVRIPRETMDALRQREVETEVPIARIVRRAIHDVIFPKRRIIR